MEGSDPPGLPLGQVGGGGKRKLRQGENNLPGEPHLLDDTL